MLSNQPYKTRNNDSQKAFDKVKKYQNMVPSFTMMELKLFKETNYIVTPWTPLKILTRAPIHRGGQHSTQCLNDNSEQETWDKGYSCFSSIRTSQEARWRTINQYREAHHRYALSYPILQSSSAEVGYFGK
jgi:hypothetical protein